MLKKLGIPILAVAAILLITPPHANAAVRFGVYVGAPVYSYPAYTYYTPYYYSYPAYSYYSYPAYSYYAYPRYSYSYHYRRYSRPYYRRHYYWR
jgi:hypothetical protein